MSSDGGVLLALLCVPVLMTGSGFAWSCFKSLALLWRCNALLGIALLALLFFVLLTNSSKARSCDSAGSLG